MEKYELDKKGNIVEFIQIDVSKINVYCASIGIKSTVIRKNGMIMLEVDRDFTNKEKTDIKQFIKKDGDK